MKVNRAAAMATMVLMGTLWGAESAVADPPPWAPAHGYRAKGKPGKGRARAAAPVRQPIDLDLSHCNRAALGAAIGGAVGGAVGSEIGDGDTRTVAIVGGTIIGIIVGGSIGRAMDQVDQNCVGQALEHAEDGQSITWTSSDQNYQVTPTRTYRASDGRDCREYTTAARLGGRLQSVYGRACRLPDGSWQLVG